MRLSAPVFHLKRKARLLSREKVIPLHQALDQIAAQEGFSSWSLLAAKTSEATPAARIFPQLVPGDMVLVGARPGQGKTLFCLELAIEAMKASHRSLFFTLEYTSEEVRDRFNAIGVKPEKFSGLFELDNSDDISSDYIIKQLSSAGPQTLAVIDYLQLLDQKRKNPELTVQMRDLQSFARDRGLILVFISQIDRKYDPHVKPCPDINDLRLPNPLDLSVFTKTCFLNNGAFRFQTAR